MIYAVNCANCILENKQLLYIIPFKVMEAIFKFPLGLGDIGSSTKSCSTKVKKKMQEKMKMILQKDENLSYIQQQYSVSFCEKIDSKSGFF